MRNASYKYSCDRADAFLKDFFLFFFFLEQRKLPKLPSVSFCFVFFFSHCFSAALSLCKRVKSLKLHPHLECHLTAQQRSDQCFPTDGLDSHYRSISRTKTLKQGQIKRYILMLPGCYRKITHPVKIVHCIQLFRISNVKKSVLKTDQLLFC